MELIIKANDIISDDLQDIREEIENIISAAGIEIDPAVVDAAAHHIYYSDEDFITDYNIDDTPQEKPDNIVDLEEILENIKIGKYTDREMSSLPCSGNPPNHNLVGVWSYDGTRAIVGDGGVDDLEIVDYSYFED